MSEKGSNKDSFKYDIEKDKNEEEKEVNAPKQGLLEQPSIPDISKTVSSQQTNTT